MTTPDPATVAAIADGLTKAQREVQTHARFVDSGWEPPNPFTPVLTEMVELGLLRRADGRCGFEAFRDSFVVPTPLGLAVRRHLEGAPDHAG